MKKILTGISAAVLSAITSIAVFAEDTTSAPTATPELTGFAGFMAKNSWITIVIYVLLLGALFYFLIIRPQRKRQKEEQNLKSSLCLGQEITTIGGIVGTIVNIKDDEITVQTSLDNTLMTFKDWAIREVKKPITDVEKK